MRAQLCPICMGDGKILKSPLVGVITMEKEEQTCHGCGGKGWVSVED